MPQEAGTVNLIVKRGAGVLLQRAVDIVPVVRRMVEDTDPLLGDAGRDYWSGHSQCHPPHCRRDYGADSRFS